MQEWGISVLFEGRNFIRLLEGLWVTLEISLISVFISVILGIGMGVLMSLNSRIIKLICRLYLDTRSNYSTISVTVFSLFWLK